MRKLRQGANVTMRTQQIERGCKRRWRTATVLPVVLMLSFLTAAMSGTAHAQDASNASALEENAAAMPPDSTEDSTDVAADSHHSLVLTGEFVSLEGSYPFIPGGPMAGAESELADAELENADAELEGADVESENAGAGLESADAEPERARAELETAGSDTLDLESLRGKLVLLDFWASWCRPCIKEIPETNAFAAEFGDREDFVFISVNQDAVTSGGDAASIRDFVRARGIEYPVLLDVAAPSLKKKFAIRAWPTRIMISPAGEILTPPAGRLTLAAAAEYLRSQ